MNRFDYCTDGHTCGVVSLYHFSTSLLRLRAISLTENIASTTPVKENLFLMVLFL